MSDKVKIVEVSPRDGLQGFKEFLPTAIKVSLIGHLAAAGVKNIEATSFVRTDKMPQFEDAHLLLEQLKNVPATLSALVPNINGFEKAEKTQVFLEGIEA